MPRLSTIGGGRNRGWSRAGWEGPLRPRVRPWSRASTNCGISTSPTTPKPAEELRRFVPGDGRDTLRAGEVADRSKPMRTLGSDHREKETTADRPRNPRIYARSPTGLSIGTLKVGTRRPAFKVLEPDRTGIKGGWPAAQRPGKAGWPGHGCGCSGSLTAAGVRHCEVSGRPSTSMASSKMRHQQRPSTRSPTCRPAHPHRRREGCYRALAVVHGHFGRSPAAQGQFGLPKPNGVPVAAQPP